MAEGWHCQSRSQVIQQWVVRLFTSTSPLTSRLSLSSGLRMVIQTLTKIQDKTNVDKTRSYSSYWLANSFDWSVFSDALACWIQRRQVPLWLFALVPRHNFHWRFRHFRPKVTPTAQRWRCHCQQLLTPTTWLFGLYPHYLIFQPIQNIFEDNIRNNVRKQSFAHPLLELRYLREATRYNFRARNSRWLENWSSRSTLHLKCMVLL